mmetsp:Transcript_10255/g.17260  ORF Transcript_10255/g.17260 Transcript_10255/m.17260 type:complete len:195 (-) Transcript_10255:165-749(-)
MMDYGAGVYRLFNFFQGFILMLLPLAISQILLGPVVVRLLELEKDRHNNRDPTSRREIDMKALQTSTMILWVLLMLPIVIYGYSQHLRIQMKAYRFLYLSAKEYSVSVRLSLKQVQKFQSEVFDPEKNESFAFQLQESLSPQLQSILGQVQLRKKILENTPHLFDIALLQVVNDNQQLLTLLKQRAEARSRQET